MQNITANLNIANSDLRAKSGTGKAVTNQTEVSSSKLYKQQANKEILRSNMEVNIKSGNEPMSLLFKTAIDGINDVLGDNAIQAAYDSGIDVSPEATADRIVSLSTAFFSSYREQNPDLSVEEAAVSFAKVIGGGIEQGFSEARDILSGLGVLDGDIASNIDKTYNLVQVGLESFVETYTDFSETQEIEA
ncbi:MAG: DUF5610 domain-containing protein [bacterium]